MSVTLPATKKITHKLWERYDRVKLYNYKGPYKLPKIHIGRRLPPTNQYKTLSSIPLDIEPFKDNSQEQNRNETELKEYLGNLWDYCCRKRHAKPKRLPNNIPHKPLYKYDNTYSTNTDLRPSYKKFLDNIEENMKEE